MSMVVQCGRSVVDLVVLFLCCCVVIVSPLTVPSEESKGSGLSEKTPRSHVPRYHEYYEAGEDAYLEERWTDCVEYMKSALESYKNFTRTIIQCRAKCKETTRRNRIQKVPEDNDIRDLETNAEVTRESLCVTSCEREQFGDVAAIHIKNQKAEENFKELKPYDYLQLCNYKLKKYQDAAEAAFTYLVGHPGHEVMTTNLQYYTSLPSVKTDKLENLEALPYAKTYAEGNEAYSRQEYPTVIQEMEEALNQYFQAEEDCRLQCEDILQRPVDTVPYRGIGQTMYQMYQCKQACQDELNILYSAGGDGEDFLPSHYHFLQFAYYYNDNLEKACEATETYLLFDPTDEAMVYNKHFYSGLPGARQEYFKPRPEALNYYRRDRAEKKFLRDMENEYKHLLTSRYPAKSKEGKRLNEPSRTEPKNELSQQKSSEHS